MQLELVVSNESRVLGGARALVGETLRQLPLPPGQASELEALVVGALQDAIEHAYRQGEQGSIKLTIREQEGKLEITVRDYGIPRDVELLERQLHSPQAARTLFGCATTGLVDEVHWLAFGPEGKALQIRKWLHVTHVAQQSATASIAPFRDDAPLAPEQSYEIRRLRADEAVQVSQLMYRAYGNTYFNSDVYYPERVAAQNAAGSVVSIVAQAADGSIVGHYALEMNQGGPVAETGQAVVDPAHRGRGLLNRMKEVVLVEAKKSDLVGWYADAVAVHTLTQKSNVDHGGCLTGVDLGISPKTEEFKGIAAAQPQRVTCLLYFHWLSPPIERTVHAPERHREMIAEIYRRLGCPVQFATAASPIGHGTLSVRMESGAARGVLRVEQLGADTVHAVRHATRDLAERSGAAVVFVELPLADPGTPLVAELLEAEGFGFAGVAPHFSERGDLLRLVYLVEPLQREPIKTYDEPAACLVEYALADQIRVRAAL